MNWELFKDILSIDSTSGKERDMALWLNDHLEAPSKELMEVGDGTLNLFLKWGTPRVVFCTHMDTVPPYIAPEFPELLELSEEGPFGGTPLATLAPAPPTGTSAGLGASSHPSLMPAGPSPYPCAGVHKPSEGSPLPITGRGSCDAKGQIFAMYTACKELEAKGCTGFGLLILAGEETGSWGAKAFSKTGFEAPFLIVGEPTDNKMVSAAKGTLSYDLKFTGEAFHSGYPQFGISAVELFNQFYNALKAVEWGLDPELGETTWNIGLLHSDNPQNILSPELTCRLYFRTTFLSHQAVQTWMAGVPEALSSALLRNPVRANAPERASAPLLTVTPRGGDVPARYVTLPGFESAPVAFGSDAPHLTGFGHKIICGPGSIKVAHRDNENVLAADLEKAVEHYVKMCRFLQNIDNK
ncbi:MAG: M20/M25/M40 family metallo-hydrolase [Bacteroidales bacterium]|nr:M20/M25/M40 family metallo-hydrolase [Bacteroidales bacterium]